MVDTSQLLVGTPGIEPLTLAPKFKMLIVKLARHLDGLLAFSCVNVYNP